MTNLLGTAGEERMNFQVIFYYSLLHVDMPAKIYVYQFSVISGHCLEDMSEVMADKDGWQRKGSRDFMLLACHSFNVVEFGIK